MTPLLAKDEGIPAYWSLVDICLYESAYVKTSIPELKYEFIFFTLSGVSRGALSTPCRVRFWTTAGIPRFLNGGMLKFTSTARRK
ncbi:MAG: hypothetical protein AAF208_11745 [Cyanobacteria bacterium P01_A01_bin.45]